MMHRIKIPRGTCERIINAPEVTHPTWDARHACLNPVDKSKYGAMNLKLPQTKYMRQASKLINIEKDYFKKSEFLLV